MEQETKQQTLFKIRDLRQKTQFKVDDAYLNGYARVCKPATTAVYNSLCRHAEFNSQKAFPSQQLIAYQHSISVDTVSRAIKKLAEYNIIIIERERRNGMFTNYIYTLLDKSEWKPIHQSAKTGSGEPNRKNTSPQKTIAVEVGTKDNKEFKDNKDNIKDNKDMQRFGVAGKEINDLIDLFKPINPSYERLFGNKTQRACLERMAKKHTKEKIERVLNILPKTNQMKYAPTITTPLQLEDKLGLLLVFIQKEKNREPKFIKI